MKDSPARWWWIRLLFGVNLDIFYVVLYSYARNLNAVNNLVLGLFRRIVSEPTTIFSRFFSQI